jgi:CRISPR-associated endonuclease/helicase Cas3
MWAHSENINRKWQTLADHLRNVATIAGDFGAAFGAREWCYYAGLWHDAGKADPAWQEYLQVSAATRRRGRTIDHKAAGVSLATEAGAGWLAFALQGHHGGLPDSATVRSVLADKVARPGCQAALAWMRGEFGAAMPADALAMPTQVARDPYATELLTRLVFSALVDADSLDTAAHMEGSTVVETARGPSMEELWERFATYHRAHAVSGDPSIAAVRTAIYDDCIRHADDPTGVFRLPAPTGGGKTRAAMAFALQHAIAHGQRSIIVAIPYLSITEQTVATYREIFEAGYEDGRVVLEHHSAMAESDADDDGDGEESVAALWRRSASENWDARIIVTTTVQLFESLFAARRSKARKVHRLANSVIILDEAQALPGALLAPILDVLKGLCAHFRSSVVLSTATQPAFETIPAFSGVAATDLVSNTSGLFEALRRVTYEWRTESGAEWPEVADWLRGEHQAMVIVNVKRHAMELLDELEGVAGVIHLSSALCGAHRRAVLDDVRRRLHAGERCLLVSTQVVEAGVDISFPVVFRALGPLDSIIQAAGRCNREGELGPGGGRVIVFRGGDERVPPDWYRTATDTTSAFVARDGFDVHDARWVAAYFRELFQMKDTDARKIQEKRRTFEFPEVAQLFRMIDDDSQPVVVTGYGTEAERQQVLDWLDELRTQPAKTRAILRKLQPYTVSLRRREMSTLRTWIGDVGGLVSEWTGGYDEIRGLVTADPEWIL